MDNSQDKTNETLGKDNSQENPDNVDKIERYKQQIDGSKKEAEKFRNLAIESEVKRAEVDANSIIELHDKDPKMANEVATRFWYSSFEDAKASLSAGTEDILQWSKEHFEEWYKEKRAMEESSNANYEADKILNTLEWDTQEEAIKYYKWWQIEEI